MIAYTHENHYRFMSMHTEYTKHTTGMLICEISSYANAALIHLDEKVCLHLCLSP